jgi:O-antigen/teichoic acid export membrane protein
MGSGMSVPSVTAEAAAAAAQPVRASGLDRLAMRGSIIELGGYGLNQALRLLTNLILSRLLFPEAYGLTAIVSVFMIALGMLTDVGLRDSIIYHERGDDPVFLDTVWTIQVMRGLGLWAVAVALSWPVAWLYGQPELCPLIIVASFANAIHGFGSTRMHTLSRHVQRGPIVVLEVVCKVVSMAVMFAWAWWSPSVWCLVAGGLAQALSETIGTHLLPGTHRNRFRIDPEASRQITSFGKWVFGSSALTFLAGEGDRILLGRLFSMAALGVYSIAGLLSSAAGLAVQRLTYAVLYGVLGKVARESPAELGRYYYAARLKLDLLAMPVLGLLMVLGPNIVGLLYDARYADAGWMLQILAVRVALQCALQPIGVCLMAMGQPRYHVPAHAGRFVMVWAGIPLGWFLGGVEGVLWATTVSELPMLAVFWTAFRRSGLLRLRRELVAPVAVATGALIGWMVQGGFSSPSSVTGGG